MHKAFERKERRMNEIVAIIIVITVYGLAIYLKLMSIENELSDIKHVKLGMIEYTLAKMSERKEE